MIPTIFIRVISTLSFWSNKNSQQKITKNPRIAIKKRTCNKRKDPCNKCILLTSWKRRELEKAKSQSTRNKRILFFINILFYYCEMNGNIKIFQFNSLSYVDKILQVSLFRSFYLPIALCFYNSIMHPVSWQKKNYYSLYSMRIYIFLYLSRTGVVEGFLIYAVWYTRGKFNLIVF